MAGLNLERYFLGPLLLSALLSIFATRGVIAYMKRHGYGQPIRAEGNPEHLKKKGTPTMGGVGFLFAVLLVVLIAVPKRAEVLLFLIGTLGYGAIGALDDVRKIRKAENEGLTPNQKLILQVALAAVLVFLAYLLLPEMGRQWIPFFHAPVDLGWLWFPVLVFVIVGTTNAVNLTDGLDGLATGASLPVFCATALMALLWRGNGTVAQIAMIFTGALIGFLFYNAHPASIMMGDTGSMAIGGALSALLLSTNLLFYLALLGGVYLAETLSVILQVAYFKRTGGKRIFRMSPIHHHFELSGYAEEKVTAAFSMVSVLLCLFTLAVA